MKYQSALKWLVPLIFLLALVAAGAGLFWPAGERQPYPLITFRGEQVQINARGLYYWDTVSSATQMQANDLVTLALGLPLLAISAWLALRGSLRGQLLLSGTLGYFLYTYMSMSMLTAFNVLFVVYVALFSLSLIAFILSLMAFDVATLPQQFSSALPRRTVASLLLATGLFLLVAWLGRIAAPWLNGTPPVLDNAITMVIQAMDLGLIVPLVVLSAILLWRRKAWGYLLASVAVMKIVTMGTAVSVMGISLALNGVPDSPIIVGIFLTLTLINFVLAVLLLMSVNARQPTLKPA